MWWTLEGLCICGIWTLYILSIIWYIMILDKAFLVNWDELKSNTAMATRINIAQVVNFDIHNGIASAQRWEKLKQRFEFSFSTSGTDDDSQMRALLLHCAKPDAHDIFMNLQDGGTTYKVAIDALNNHFKPLLFGVWKKKLLLILASKVWVLFWVNRTLKIVFFEQWLLPVAHYRTQRPDIPKLNQKH